MDSVVISYGMQSFCRQKARRQKLHAFAFPTLINEINYDELGRLCGHASFRGFAGIDKTQDPSDGCVLWNCKQFLRRRYTLLVLLRHAVVSSTKGASTKAARLRTHPACTPHMILTGSVALAILGCGRNKRQACPQSMKF